MKKKTLIVILSVVLVCALGLFLSQVFHWPVSSDSAGGNIGKSSRFSRKTATERIDNLEELLKADENYKNSIVLAYSVMQTRAMQFAALVDMSNQVADDIPEFEGVLKDMNESAPMVKNVVESLSLAGTDINTVLKGESCPDVTQNTINASLAYTTLQRQNELANRFIETTDKYIKKADASDELLFVRDQWVNYQQMTAALEGDTKAARELNRKGTLLPPEKAESALNEFDVVHKIPVILGVKLSDSFDVSNSQVDVLPLELVNEMDNILVKAVKEAEVLVQNMEDPTLVTSLVPKEIFDPFRMIVAGEVSEMVKDGDLSDQYDPRKFYHTGILEDALLKVGINDEIVSARNLIIKEVAPGFNYDEIVPDLGVLIEQTALGIHIRVL